jgi:hypothetical protein
MNYTNDNDLPQPFVNAVKSNHRYTPKRYSVTDVLGGTCEAVLKRRHDSDITEDVSQRIWALFGTAVHKVLQEAEATDSQLQENWLSVPIGNNGYELSGIFDLYDDETKTVTDWKTCATWKIIFGDFGDWRKQTLVYCWMLRNLGIDACHGEIVAIMRDHSMRKAKFEKDYPPHPVYKIGWDFGEEDFEQVETDIMQWFAEVMHEETVPDTHLEPCSPEQRWHKPDKWAVMEKGRKKALRVLDSEDAAKEWAIGKGIDPTDTHYYLEHREGEDTRCQSYCSVAQFCPYGKGLSNNEAE